MIKYLRNNMEPLNKLNKILQLAKDIENSDLGDEEKYDMIFSDKISLQVAPLFKELNVCFEYCDPDTSYDEDVRAFISALESELEALNKNLENDYSKDDLLRRYNKL